MIEHSESIGEIMAAIGSVQTDIDYVEKDLTNPHYGNSYASLNSFLHALRPALAVHSLVMTQAPGMDEGGRVVVDTLLYHRESGEWLQNRSAAPIPKDDPQGLGSALTYLKRYAIASLFALPQEDDDGNAASRGNGASRNGTDAKVVEALLEMGTLHGMVEPNEEKRVKGALKSKDAEKIANARKWLQETIQNEAKETA